MTKIHPSAVIDKDAQLAENVQIGPNCIVNKGACIGSGTVLQGNVVIGKDVKIGEDNQFFPNSVIGGDPQILGLDPDQKIGDLEIGDKNIFREQVTVHPSMHQGKKTSIGNNNLLMIGVHIGHDCHLASELVMSNYVQVSGHCRIEQGVWLSGLVVIHQFITVGRWSYAAGLTGINHDIPPYLIVSGHYPPRIRGVNKRGMRRAGLSEEEQKQVYEAYKKIYRRKGPLLKNANELARQNGLDEHVKMMVESIQQSSRHRFGRYLELFRD